MLRSRAGKRNSAIGDDYGSESSSTKFSWLVVYLAPPFFARLYFLLVFFDNR